MWCWSPKTRSRPPCDFLLARLKVLVEPSGAVAAAAVLFHKLPAGLGPTGIILSGGNVDADVLSAILSEI